MWYIIIYLRWKLLHTRSHWPVFIYCASESIQFQSFGYRKYTFLNLEPSFRKIFHFETSSWFFTWTNSIYISSPESSQLFPAIWMWSITLVLGLSTVTDTSTTKGTMKHHFETWHISRLICTKYITLFRGGISTAFIPSLTVPWGHVIDFQVHSV